jgi:hypothetical protein
MKSRRLQTKGHLIRELLKGFPSQKEREQFHCNPSLQEHLHREHKLHGELENENPSKAKVRGDVLVSVLDFVSA